MIKKKKQNLHQKLICTIYICINYVKQHVQCRKKYVSNPKGKEKRENLFYNLIPLQTHHKKHQHFFLKYLSNTHCRKLQILLQNQTTKTYAVFSYNATVLYSTFNTCLSIVIFYYITMLRTLQQKENPLRQISVF